MHGICYRIFVENGSFSNRMESEFMLANNWMYVGPKPPGNLGCVGHIVDVTIFTSGNTHDKCNVVCAH